MKVYLSSLILLIYTTVSFGQTESTTRSPYRVYRTYELPASLVVLGTSIFGYRQLDRYANLTADEVSRLNPAQINAFDRPVAFLDPARFDGAQKRSDRFLNISIASPILLILSQRIRKEGLDVLTLYTTAHAINNLLYFGTAFSIRRARPLTYNPGLQIDEKTGNAKSNSFYSGHVSFSTTATFFAAKVLTDFYHIKGWKRVAIFTAAAVPPILVGVNRMEAGKHFRTDVMTGFLVGAAVGIGVPELHKRSRKTDRLSFQPQFSRNGARGLAVSYTF
ncbi:phosphatase PAP2 family protein [Larkinella terrae]|uniref:Phosphatase PAP2 family protein n=1 Tax=Larkinella terrae TaxID=2025311 RepID=A0A7K0ETH2_9BACT|nr:phosphatase PAP2 family protein [Larkinella terrae]MRS65113.1 phosphatase PAP2 family protein [Larkinella terrae]